MAEPYRLYWAPTTGSFVVELLLREAGAPHETLRVQDRRAEDFLAVNPLGKVPVLELPDGTVMTESAAMVLQLFEAYPEADFSPKDAEAWARARRWLMFLTCELYTAYQQMHHSEHFTVGSRIAWEEVKAAGRGRVRELWKIFEAQALNPGPFVLGDRYSGVDVYAAMLTSWDPSVDALLTIRPKLGALVQAVCDRPEAAAVIEKYKMSFGK